MLMVHFLPQYGYPIQTSQDLEMLSNEPYPVSIYGPLVHHYLRLRPKQDKIDRYHLYVAHFLQGARSRVTVAAAASFFLF